MLECESYKALQVAIRCAKVSQGYTKYCKVLQSAMPSNKVLQAAAVGHMHIVTSCC